MTPALAFEKFGKYEIVRKLGRSMTDVYLAFDCEAQRYAVLKIVEESKDSFTQVVMEAERRGAAIQQQLYKMDPRILEVYEFGEQQGCFFVAMQYAEGRSLADILQRDGRLDAPRAARYTAEVLSQLSTLHSFQVDIDGQKQAVVHGDIKPSNIQIGPKGEVWLLDFGIAKAITATRNLTHHNLGSPAYCSPERLKSAQVDPAADLWAVGVCLYEMVAALPPYQAQTTRKLENLIQSRRPPRALPQGCPEALKAIIWRALAADAEGRYSSAREFENDLKAFLANTPTAAESAKRPSWDANATMQRAQQAIKSVPQTTRDWRGHWGGKIAEINVMLYTLLAGFVFGLLFVVPAQQYFRFWKASAPIRARGDYILRGTRDMASDWGLYQSLAIENSLLGRFSPVQKLAPVMRSNLLSTAYHVLDAYRQSSDPEPANFEWDKARIALAHVHELTPSDREVNGKLEIAGGFAELSHGITPTSARAAESHFRQALKLVPNLPDPHLGLARLYVYSAHNIGAAMAEFHAVETLGYRVGPRELEQQADGYLFRAERELGDRRDGQSTAAQARMLAFARRDLDRARSLYEPIAGFSHVNGSLERLERDDATQSQSEIRLAAMKKRDRQKKLHAGNRRWR